MKRYRSLLRPARRYGTLLRPTMYAPRISKIALPVLIEQGIRGIIVDLDNTLVGYQLPEPAQEDAAWIAAAAQAGIDVIMVTNNRTVWAQNVAKTLGIACIPNARKPLPRGFLRALKLLQLEKDAVIVIGDQIFTDVLGAKLFGLKVILTEPLVHREEWWMRYLRFFERIVLRGVPRGDEAPPRTPAGPHAAAAQEHDPAGERRHSP